MLQNVIDVDWNAMTVSLKSKHGALVLFDFRAAFPSVSHPFLKKCLELLGLPKEALNFISSLYSESKCFVRFHGQDFTGFSMRGGVRQGCPLSPLLFAVCVDILLRMLVHVVPDCTCKAFADDIAAILSDWWEQGPLLEKVFHEFEQISNLGLNVNKTICIPLWIEGVGEVKKRTPQLIPGWANVCVDSKGTYLGFVVGPGKGTESWDKPLSKFRDRVSRWSGMGGGMQYASVAYNVFALSTLLYVAQLEPIPDFVIQEERRLVLSIFPGPGNWVTPEDLWCLREGFGFAKAPQSLRLVARAAKLRVASLACHFDCKYVSAHRLRRHAQDNIFSRCHALRNTMNQTDFLDRMVRWAGWYKHGHCAVLVDNMHWLKSKGITSMSLYAKITTSEAIWTGEDVRKIKRDLQRVALSAIKDTEPPQVVERIRTKVARWNGLHYGLSGHPGHYSESIAKRVVYLAKLVTPRVHAATFTTLWNGWCTHRRFQNRRLRTNLCLFRCGGEAEDSLEHYCRCPVVLNVARRLFRFSYHESKALNIWALNSSWLDNEKNLRSLALLVYGSFMAFNSIRHNGISDASQAFHCIVQHCKQGAMGHAPSMKHIDTCWQSPVSHII